MGCLFEKPYEVETGMKDTFNGDTAALCRAIEALLALDAANALVPHGIGGHARNLLEAAAIRLSMMELKGES